MSARGVLLALLLPVGPALAETPDTVWLEELTWEEVRDQIKGGKKAVIIPTGGTEQNGPHMLLGKHNIVVRFAAETLARRLSNTLVAPVLQYVPEGDYNRPGFGDKPGVITCLPPTFVRVLEHAARSFRAHGFTEILLIGDSGGNQQPLKDAATRLNQEWSGTGARAFALTDYYSVGRQNLRAFLLARYGYDDQIIGSHAGISDTSQVLYLHPAGIRPSRLAPGGGSPDSGVSGDPTKASAEIGRMGLEFKIDAAIQQYRALTASEK
jgi:creatinine amidohydrolase